MSRTVITGTPQLKKIRAVFIAIFTAYDLGIFSAQSAGPFYFIAMTLVMVMW
jgi:hypothetical protein